MASMHSIIHIGNICIHTYKRAYRCIYTHTHIRIDIHLAHTYTGKYTYTYKHTQYTYTCAHIHAHLTHRIPFQLSLGSWLQDAQPPRTKPRALSKPDPSAPAAARKNGRRARTHENIGFVAARRRDLPAVFCIEQ